MESLRPSQAELGELLVTYGTDQSFDDIVDLLHNIVHVKIPDASP